MAPAIEGSPTAVSYAACIPKTEQKEWIGVSESTEAKDKPRPRRGRHDGGHNAREFSAE